MPPSHPTPGSPRSARSGLRTGGALGSAALLAGGSAAALLAALAAPAGAAGATFIVDDASDTAAMGDPTHCTDGTPGNCTLRDAAVAAGDGDTITFASGITAITLTQGVIDLDATNITGPGAPNLTIGSQAATEGNYSIFYTSSSAVGDVVISGITVTTNRITTAHAGDLTLDRVTVTGSKGAGSGYGGGLYAHNVGDLFIIDSTFDGNYGMSKGGGAYAHNVGAVTITGSTFTDNTTADAGGGFSIGSNVTNATITGSQFRDNTAVGSGAGALNFLGYGELRIERTTFDGNHSFSSGGALYSGTSAQTLTILASTFSNNTSAGLNEFGGGAIAIWGDTDVVLANSTLTGNSAGASGGGALYVSQSGANVSILQSTIAENSAVQGGGILTHESLSLSGTIVSANTVTEPTSSAPVTGTLAVDPASADIGGVAVTVTSDHSLVGIVGEGAGQVTFTDLGGTIRSSTPALLALADNGGPTMTMALDPTSAAVDAGPDPVPTFPGNEDDQRGAGYARIAFGRADIGAYEIQEPPAPEPEPEPGPLTPAFTG